MRNILFLLALVPFVCFGQTFQQNTTSTWFRNNGGSGTGKPGGSGLFDDTLKVGNGVTLAKNGYFRALAANGSLGTDSLAVGPIKVPFVGIRKPFMGNVGLIGNINTSAFGGDTSELWFGYTNFASQLHGMVVKMEDSTITLNSQKNLYLNSLEGTFNHEAVFINSNNANVNTGNNFIVNSGNDVFIKSKTISLSADTNIRGNAKDFLFSINRDFIIETKNNTSPFRYGYSSFGPNSSCCANSLTAFKLDTATVTDVDVFGIDGIGGIGSIFLNHKWGLNWINQSWVKINDPGIDFITKNNSALFIDTAQNSTFKGTVKASVNFLGVDPSDKNILAQRNYVDRYVSKGISKIIASGEEAGFIDAKLVNSVFTQIFVDGSFMTSGSDYIVNSSNGQITFTPPLSVADRVSILITYQ